MSNLDVYKDNILMKIQKNKEIDEILEWLSRRYCPEVDKIEIRTGFLSPKFSISKNIFVDVLKSIKKYNDERVEQYLAMSFDKDYCKKRNEQAEENNNG